MSSEDTKNILSSLKEDNRDMLSSLKGIYYCSRT